MMSTPLSPRARGEILGGIADHIRRLQAEITPIASCGESPPDAQVVRDSIADACRAIDAAVAPVTKRSDSDVPITPDWVFDNFRKLGFDLGSGVELNFSPTGGATISNYAGSVPLPTITTRGRLRGLIAAVADVPLETKHISHSKRH